MIRVGIVEDEYFAQRVLINLLGKFHDTLEIVHVSKTFHQAQKDIKEHRPQVVFLDIELPGGNGMQLIEDCESIQAKIIFTTAYEEYAVKAFEASAVDYLLKPIIPQRLKKSITRVKDLLLKDESSPYHALKSNLEQQHINTITIRVNGVYERISVSQIKYFKAEGSYTKIVTHDSSYLQSKKLNNYESILQENPIFFRNHRSWMINLNEVDTFSKSEKAVYIDGIKIPISSSNYTAFMTAFNV